MLVHGSYQCHSANPKDVEEAKDDVSKVKFVSGDDDLTTTTGSTTTAGTGYIQCIDSAGNFECVLSGDGCSSGYSPNPSSPSGGMDETVCNNLEVIPIKLTKHSNSLILWVFFC